MSYLTSPPFEYAIPKLSLNPGESFAKTFEYEVGTEGLYVPFNQITVDNFSTARLRLDYGAGHYVIIHPSSTMSIEQLGIRGFSLKNIDTNANDDDIIVYVQKSITADLALESIVRRIPIEKLMNG